MKNYIAVAREENPRKDNQDAIRCAESVQKALKSKGIPSEIVFIDPSYFENKAKKLNEWLLDLYPDCIFNLFEGFSDDAFKEIEFVKVLEKNGIVFTGNSSQALAICLNKEQCKSILNQTGVLVPHGMIVKSIHDIKNVNLEYPVFIKPCCEDASLGVDEQSLCNNQKEMLDAVTDKLALFKDGLLIEEFIVGDEYNVSFVENYPYEMLAISKIDYSSYPQCLPFISYESKWDETSVDYQQLTFKVVEDGSQKFTVMMMNSCQTAGKALQCQGYFRVDLREKAGKFYVLDVNPNPDINEDSGFIRQAKAAGFSYPDIIKKIFLGAIHGKHKKIITR